MEVFFRQGRGSGRKGIAFECFTNGRTLQEFGSVRPHHQTPARSRY
jgi:hypothetical protein